MILNLFISFVTRILNLEIFGFRFGIVLIEIAFITIIFNIIKAIKK